MMEGSGGSTDTTRTSDPWAEAVPYLTEIMSSAQNLYQTGAGTGDWSGETVMPLDGNLTQAFTDMASVSSGLPSLTDTMNTATSSIANNGLTSDMQTQLGYLDNIASGTNQITTGGQFGNLSNTALTQNATPNSVLSNVATGTSPLTTLANSTSGQNNDALNTLSGISTSNNPTAAAQHLTGMASQGSANPYVDRIVDDQAARIANRVNSAMSGAGRYGSYGHGDALAQSISSATNPLLMQAYDSDQNRRLQAAGLIDSSNLAQTGLRANAANSLAGIRQGDTQLQGNLLNSGIQNQLTAASTLADSNRADLTTSLSALTGQTGVESQNIANQQSAATDSLSGLQNAQTQSQAWASLLPSLMEASYIPSEQMAQVGEYLQNYGQTWLDSQVASATAEEQEPWQQLMTYLSSITGTSPLTGSSGTTTGESSSTAPWFGNTGLVNLLGLA